MSTPPCTEPLPKICGADVELGNFVEGIDSPGGSGALASRALLAEIPGLPLAGRDSVQSHCDCAACRERRQRGLAPSAGGNGGMDPQEWGRRFLPTNGGCAYIDLDHLELCVPEVRSAYDHVAAWHAMLRIAQGALAAANAKLADGAVLRALVNNSDGRGNSYGGHLSFLVARRTWDDLFRRKPHYLAFLAAHQASSIVFCGQGKVGSENGAAPSYFQLAQRADFFETLVGPQTTYYRPLVNSRDEPLCGERRLASDGEETGALARLHVIYADSSLCPVATLLKVGSLQIVLAMLEQGELDPTLALEDPVEAIRLWSHDARLELAQPLTDGRPIRAVELQLRLLDLAGRFVAAGRCRGLVPRAVEIVALWRDTVEKLAAGDLAALAPRLDWVLKLALLGRALATLPGRGWEAPELKHLDFLYGSLAPEQGLYWAMERAGQVEQVVTPRAVEQLTTRPPRDTRAYARAELLRRAPAESVAAVDWDRIRFELPADATGPRSFTVRLGDPRRSGRRRIAAAAARSESFAELLGELGERAPLAPIAPARTGISRWVEDRRFTEGESDAISRTSA